MYNIQKIEGDFGNVDFVNSERIDYPSSRKIDEIILSYKNSQVKNIKFDYSYFDSKNSITTLDRKDQLSIRYDYGNITDDQLSKRLKLNSVTFNNSESYHFIYDQTYLVNKDSFAVDYWGYFNGQITNNSLFANPSDFYVNIPVNNDYNNNIKRSLLVNAKSGILTKIIYPTKGYSSYEYELNQADNLFQNYSTISEGHGLRIRSQSNYDQDNSLQGFILFEYEGGKAINPLDLFKDYNYSTIKSSFPHWEENRYNILSTLASSDNNVSPLSSGEVLGYSKVTKYEVDGNGDSKGKIVTTYSNHKDIIYSFKDDNIPLYIPTIKDYNHHDNGLVLKVEYYNNYDQLLKKDSLLYTDKFPSSYLYYGSALALNHNVFYNSMCNQGNGGCSLAPTPISSFSYYPIYLKESRLTGKVSKEYLNNKEIETTESYTYDNYDLIKNKSVLFTDSNISEQYSYTYNLSAFLNKNIISEPSVKTIRKNGIRIYERKIGYFSDGSHYNPISLKETTLSGAENTIQFFDRYDSKGNLLQYTANTGIPVSIIWGYNNTQPIAKIEGATYAKVSSYITDIVNASNTDASEGSDNDETSFLNVLNTFRTNPALAGYQVTTYTYDPLIGVRTITPPSGVREYYKYDTANRLQEVKDVNGNLLKTYEYNYKP